MAAPFMNRFSPSSIFIIWLLSYVLIMSAEPITIGIATSAVVMGVAFKYGGWAKCRLYDGECCDSDFIKPDFPGLAAALKSQVYGQHLVEQATIKSLKAHYQHHQPSKALALSFHGITGSGKNHVSNIIVKYVYQKGMDSHFVHFFSATYHFPHAGKIEEYKEFLRNRIIEAVTACERSIFIFDEMDKMPPSLVNTVAAFLDYHHKLNGVDYRKVTFIFLSNTAGAEISRMAFDHWKQGKKREEIRLVDLQALVTVLAYNEQGGWWHNSLMEKHLVSVFVPFLPLERQHIKKCVVNELDRRRRQCDHKFEDCDTKYRPTEALVNRIADMVSYYPEKSPVFATSGCKRITDDVSLAFMDED